VLPVRSVARAQEPGRKYRIALDSRYNSAPPPIDPVPATVEIRKADVGPSGSVKLCTPRPVPGMIGLCFGASTCTSVADEVME
jgi:hypothetical protein